MLNYSGIPRIQDIRRPANLSRNACKWEDQLCHRISPTVGTKSTSIRFKVSVLTKVLLTSNQFIYHKGGDPRTVPTKRACNAESSFEIDCCSEYATGEHLENSGRAVHKSTTPTTSLLVEGTEATLTVPDGGGPKKRKAEAIVVDTWLQPAKFRSRKISFKSEVSHASQHPRAAVLWIGKSWGGSKKYWSSHLLSIRNKKTNTRLQESWFQDCKRTQENPNRKLQETSHHSSRQSSIREEFACRQKDCLDDLRLLQICWRQWSWPQRLIESSIKERQRSSLRHKVGRSIISSHWQTYWQHIGESVRDASWKVGSIEILVSSPRSRDDIRHQEVWLVQIEVDGQKTSRAEY